MNIHIQERLEDESYDVEKTVEEIAKLKKKWIKLNSDLRRIVALEKYIEFKKELIKKLEKELKD